MLVFGGKYWVWGWKVLGEEMLVEIVFKVEVGGIDLCL